ncbi:MAG: rRNA ((966)-N(2))-methyltransferase RsmD [Pseudomonadota bacterium]|jgi:16S rRNA (guanine966-N2)-methyltransferase
MSTKTAPSTAHAPQAVRIIGGRWKRTPLPVPHKPGLRPTPSRVRETLFNWLGQDLSGWRCCDAFAGSGALGLEAASRGASQVSLIEQNAQLVAQLQRLCTQLKASGVSVQRADALAVLPTLSGLDVVFLDPPFEAGPALIESALRAASAAIKPEGWVYVESPSAWTNEALAPMGLTLHKQGRAGAVHFALLAKAPALG